MSKPKKQSVLNWTWRDYALQLSVVVTGIVVTFVGSDLIGRWSRAREEKAVMQLVVSELETNRSQVERVCLRLVRDRHGMLMFQHYGFDLDRIPDDSLAAYNSPHIIGSQASLRLQTDALEVFKSSGLSASVADKQLLLSLLACYNELQSFSETIDAYNGRKIIAIDHLFEHMPQNEMDYFSIGGTDIRTSWKTMLADRMCQSFMGFSAYFFGDDELVMRPLVQLDAAIGQIKEKYAFK